MQPFFGFGRHLDGNATLTGTDAPIDSSTSTTDPTHLNATNPSFAAGRFCLVVQMRGATPMLAEIVQTKSYSPGSLETMSPMVNTYVDSGADQAQVIQLPEYGNAYVSGTFTGKAWDGNVGGIVAFLADYTSIPSGSFIDVRGKGFRGGAAVTAFQQAGKQGEGISADGGTQTTAANSNGGGGGGAFIGPTGGAGQGGGGGHATEGQGVFTAGVTPSTGGSIVGSVDLSQLSMGGGGGSGGTRFNSPSSSGKGGNGGGFVLIFTRKLLVRGGIKFGGNDGEAPVAPSGGMGAGGGGGGGGCLIKSVEADIGVNLLDGRGGVGGVTVGDVEDGGVGGLGRLRIETCKLTGSNALSDTSIVLGGKSWCGSLASIVE